MKKVKVILTTVVISFMFTGCYLDDYRNIEEVQIDSMDPVFGFPLINSSVTIEDLLAAADSTTFIEVRNDSVFLLFNQEMNFGLDLNKFNVPDKTFVESIDLHPTGVAFAGYAENYTTIENESEIKRVDIKSGTLTIVFERDFLDDDLEMAIIIKSLSTPSERDSVVRYSGWAPNSCVNAVSIDLAGATLELEARDRITGLPIYNTFSWAISLKTTSEIANRVTGKIIFSDIEFEKITGLINHEIPITTQTVGLGVFSSVIDGEILLSESNVFLNIGSSFGTPSSAEITSFLFKNRKNETLELENKGVLYGNMLRLGTGEKNYLPYTTASEPYVKQRLYLNSENSNIENVLSIAPLEASLDGNFKLGDFTEFFPSVHNFFVCDTSAFHIDLEVEVPLAGSIKDLKFQKNLENFSWPVIDTIPMLADFDYNVEILLKTTNQIPLTFGLQMVFIENGVAIDSLFSNPLNQNIVQSPRVDNQGLPLASTEKMTIVQMDRTKYDKISKASQMRLNLYLETGTESQRNVLFKASQNLDVQMAVRFRLKLKPEN